VPTTTPKREAIQAQVLRATENLLAEGTSWNDLGVERIATTAGISRTAFYFYFSDKRELLTRLAEAVMADLYREADRWFSGDGDDPKGEVRTAIENIAALYDEHRALLRVIVEVSTYDEEVAGFWREIIGRFVDATRGRIETEQAAGNVRTFPAEPTAFALVWMGERVLYQLVVQDPEFSRQQAVDALVDIFVRTIYG
jgi:AcrR family transcriptional regulator